MSQRRVKQWRRQVKKQAGAIVEIALLKTLQEPFGQRARVAWHVLKGEAETALVVHAAVSTLIMLAGLIFILALLLAPHVLPEEGFRANIQHLIDITL